jgi:hypothetical protein
MALTCTRWTSNEDDKILLCSALQSKLDLATNDGFSADVGTAPCII